ncbi:cytochrome c oxidase polypeptide III [Halarchaeum acidiphilum MH1-52-1]|uniref:Cytochrome c oxidase polypeptide III n=2 Tax=Halarchaeum acidiphilum TaxID=489138 RepID=U2YSE3_9EURY|nr:cytochrome c oxidase subunit 3 [Halarchaeum acidiphilum]GAD51915.1 cytochrome c oxidase polypeptide III [Halarchaeum acidiphilum MH1-52-1]
MSEPDTDTTVEALNAEETTRGAGKEGFPHGSPAPFVLGAGIFGICFGFIYPIEWIVGVPVFVAGLYLWLREYSVGEYEGGVIPEQKRQLLGVPSSYLAGLLAIVSEALLFGGAFIAWFFLAAQRGPFPTAGSPALHPLFGGLEALALVVGSAVLYWTRTGVGAGDRGRLSTGLPVAFLAGIAYLALTAVDWSSLLAAGLTPTAGAYGAGYYFVAGLHAVHVLVGLTLVSLVAYRYRARGHFDRHRFTMVRVAEAYWHFLAGISVVILLLIYVPTS